MSLRNPDAHNLPPTWKTPSKKPFVVVVQSHSAIFPLLHHKSPYESQSTNTLHLANMGKQHGSLARAGKDYSTSLLG